MAAAVFLLIGAALGLSAVAAAGGTGLLGRLWGRLSGAEAARQDRIDARDANAEGRRLFARGQFGPALERFRRAHELEPEVAEYHNNVGWALFKLKRGPEAVRVLEAVVRKHPDRHLAYENLAAAHLIAGDTAAALATLEHLLSAGPGAARRRTAERLLARLRQPAPAADTAFLDPGTVVESEGTPETPAWMTPAPVVEADWTAPVQVDTFAAPATAETESTPAAVATPVSHRQREERTVPPRKPGSRRGAPRDTVFVARPDRFADTVHIRPL
jgi:tetratricopeptide (TPR) repeat protein